MSVRIAVSSVNVARRNARHAALLAGVSLVALLLQNADAGARPLGAYTPSPSQAAVAAAQSGAAEAARAARQAQNSLQRATRVIQAMQATQQAARHAARAALAANPSGIPHGLKPGGLQPMPGATPSPTDGGAGLWQGANLPGEFQDGDRVKVTVQQTRNKAILNWQTFNVSEKTDLYFDQKTHGGADASNWIALNRVLDPSASPSRILGTIKADGQVYIINRNGIIFGGPSQINTGGLIASTLSYRNEQFIDNAVLPAGQIRLPTSAGAGGITEPIVIQGGGGGNYLYLPEFGESAQTSSTTDFVPDHVPGDVIVEAGAQVGVTGAGRLMMFGRQVHNRGTLSVADGQVILAAGEQVYIRGPVIGDQEQRFTDLHTIGHLEVLASAASDRIPAGANSNQRPAQLQYIDQRSAGLDFKVVNSGQIIAQRGDITLQGRTVEQAGLLYATTALNNRAGSIHLRGANGGWFEHNDGFTGWRVADAGNVFIRSGATNLVMPDADTSTLEISQLATRYRPSRIELAAENITVENSFTWVPGGDLDVFAVSHWVEPKLAPNNYYTGVQNTWTGRVYLDEGAVLSAGGMPDISAPMSRNNVRIELFINELADSPLQRNGILYGNKDIWIDRRDTGVFQNGPMAGVDWFGEPGRWYGTPLANASGWLGNATTSIQEQSALGGISSPPVTSSRGRVRSSTSRAARSDTRPAKFARRASSEPMAVSTTSAAPCLTWSMSESQANSLVAMHAGM